MKINDPKIAVLVLPTVILLGVLITENRLAFADCRGCCSGHGGVVCVDGKTRCKDGTGLSSKCRAKKCNKCGSQSGSTTSGNTNRPFRDPTGGYDRGSWPHWIDEDGDCQNTRTEILIRDNIGNLKFKRNKRCNVSWGEWRCPYTGKVFEKASDVDIDHIVPLAHAHQSGGANWTRSKKRRFANDPTNLIAVEDNINQQKRDQAPHQWKPPLKVFWKKYAQLWRAVKKKYRLKISAEEEAALRKMEQ